MPGSILVIVNEMVFRVGNFAVKGLVFEDAVEKAPRGIHARAPSLGWLAVNRFREHAQRLGVAFETSEGLHTAVERAFAAMPKGRVAEVVGKAGRLNEIGIDVGVFAEEITGFLKIVTDRTSDLGHLERVGQPGAIKVVLSREENLGLALQAAERRGVKHSVAVDLKGRPIVLRTWVAGGRFPVECSVEPVFHRVSLRRVRAGGAQRESPEIRLAAMPLRRKAERVSLARMMIGNTQLPSIRAQAWRFVLVLVCGSLSACSHWESIRSGGGASSDSGLSDAEIESIREQLVAHPLPEEPVYGRTSQTCFFFVENPRDGSMVPVGLLEKDAFVILRERDGEWTDMQLTSGQLGSVMTSNLRDLTTSEDDTQEYLKPQPELRPLTWPQANRREESGIDPVLLGG